MKTSDAINHFGSKAAIATALEIHRASVSQWGEKVPPRRAYELERITGGQLQADTGVDVNRIAETESQNATPVAKQG